MYMPPTESVVATSLMLICHYWSPYLSERETVLEAQLTGLGLWKIKYRRILTIRIMTLTGTGSSTLYLKKIAQILLPQNTCDAMFSTCSSTNPSINRIYVKKTQTLLSYQIRDVRVPAPRRINRTSKNLLYTSVISCGPMRFLSASVHGTGWLCD
jgi:hypothetical protein